MSREVIKEAVWAALAAKATIEIDGDRILIRPTEESAQAHERRLETVPESAPVPVPTRGRRPVEYLEEALGSSFAAKGSALRVLMVDMNPERSPRISPSQVLAFYTERIDSALLNRAATSAQIVRSELPGASLSSGTLTAAIYTLAGDGRDPDPFPTMEMLAFLRQLGGGDGRRVWSMSLKLLVYRKLLAHFAVTKSQTA